MKRLIVCLLVLACATTVRADPVVKSGDLIAIVGDSITEQKLYSVFIEDYLLMCKPAGKDVKTMQFGWGGETSWGFAARMENDCLRFKSNVMTTCYGMNDGGYGPLTEERAAKYRQATEEIIEKFIHAGGRTIVIGSPGVVDTYYAFGRDAAKAAVYNKTLAQLRDMDREIAQKHNLPFADVHGAMLDAMTKAKAALGEDYCVAGLDGVHPAANGHLVMAYAFLKALGCDGKIAMITVDLAAGKAEASEGHSIKSSDGGSVTIVSDRYPFCFYGDNDKPNDPKSPSSMREIIKYFPFNDELNHFTLIVKNANAPRLKVTWGGESKDFSKSDLERGVNLAAEFLENPFSKNFKKVHDAVRAQQNFETVMIKNLIHGVWETMPNEKDLLDQLATATAKKQQSLSDAAHAAVTPVTHTIRIEAAQ